MSDGRVEFEIKADNSSVSATISDTTNKLKAAAGQWESSTTQASNSSAMFSGVLQGVGQTLGGIVAGAAKNAGKAVVQFGKECISAASALNETKNVVDTVFGDNAAQIYSWAKSAQGAFGLTETQALKYTSTLGAMMKSSGLAQNEIGSMSTALAGLAADMASFYNMDFDTAFEKIRSGISGETEPLKQLGINLSVANLEAFALAQGIKKTYQEMSQAEQVALRYQYIMQATSDAQGDFQRTSDGYANSIRRIETAWASIQTAIGTTLMTVVEPAVSAFADLLEKITAQPERTLFDELNDIEVDYESEVKKIESTHQKAQDLVNLLEELHQQATQPVNDSGLGELIESLATSIPGLYDDIQGKNPTEQISALASALSEGSGISTDAWTEALTHYDEFSGALAEAMASDDPTGAIKALADELARGSDIDAKTWEQILTTFADALDTSDLKDKASGTAGTIEGLVAALAESIPDLNSKLQGKNPAEQISALAEALSEGSGISADAWTNAITHYEEFAGALSDAMASDDPTGAIKNLADELARGSDIDASTWESILTKFASAIDTSDLKQKASDTSSTIGGLVTALKDSIPGLNSELEGKNPAEQISTLADALAKGSSLSTDAWTNAITHYEDFASKLAEAMASDDPTAAISALAEELAAGSEISVDGWTEILTTFSSALTDSKLSENAKSASGTINDLVTALAKSVPELNSAIEGKNPADQITALADALSKGSGVSMEAWTAALTNYEDFSGQLSAAMNAENPTEAIRALADELARGSDISVADWTEILTTFAGALQESTVGSDAADLKGEIDKLSDTLSMKTGISASKWKTVFQEFDGYKADFFSALSSDNPQEKLNDLAKTLAGNVEGGLSAAEWNSALTLLAGYIKTGDENLDTAGIVGKMNALTGAIQSAEGTSLKDALSKYKNDVGTVDSTSIDAWTAVLGAFSSNFGSFKTALSNYNAGTNTTISGLASALSGIDGDEAKVNAWNTLLTLLAESGEEISSYYGSSEEGFAKWIESVKDSINSIDPDNAEAWNSLLSLLAEGKFGDLETGNVEGELSGLTGEMESAYYASEAELAVLRELVNTFPELSSVIDVNTGEIKGGVEAIQKYLKASKDAALQIAAQKRIQAELDAINRASESWYDKQVEAAMNEREIERATEKAQRYKELLDQLGSYAGYNAEYDFYRPDSMAGGLKLANMNNPAISGQAEALAKEGINTVEDLANAYNNATNDVTRYTNANEELNKQIAEEGEALDYAKNKVVEDAEALGVDTEALDANSSATEANAAAKEAQAKALTDLQKQLQSIISYQESARKSALNSLDQVASGFKAVDRASEEYRKSMSANTMYQNLTDQLAFLDEYSNMLDTLKNKGVSDDIIAAIADGSIESMQYLRGLATATADEIEQLNEKYGTVKGKKTTLADKIAAEKLAVDQEYQAMIDKAMEMAAAMDQSGAAGENAAATMTAIVSAVSAGNSELAVQVAETLALIAQLGQIGGFTVGGSLGSGGGFSIVGNNGGFSVGYLAKPKFSNALGLDFVPYDGYVSELHRGEAVLTADEAAIWRNFTGMGDSADQQAFDYDLLTASISSGMPSTGGNVYLDGRTVGKIISEGMGDSYRRLGRSGWRG